MPQTQGPHTDPGTLTHAFRDRDRDRDMLKQSATTEIGGLNEC